MGMAGSVVDGHGWEVWFMGMAGSVVDGCSWECG